METDRFNVKADQALVDEIVEIKHRYTGYVLFEHKTTEQQNSGLAMRDALESAVLSNADLIDANLIGANLIDANLRDANLIGANLIGANLGGADLRGANLRDADLIGANLIGANLIDANLIGADLRGANLISANLREADLGDKKLIGRRPVLTIGPIGSRGDYLVAYMTDGGVLLKTGCFSGSTDEFRVALENQHGENVHAQEYTAALELVECHERLWAA